MFQTNDCLEMYAFFYEKAVRLLTYEGILSFITASLFIKGLKFDSLRSFLEKQTQLVNLRVVGDYVFENVKMPTVVVITIKQQGVWSFADMVPGGQILSKMDNSGLALDKIYASSG